MRQLSSTSQGESFYIFYLPIFGNNYPGEIFTNICSQLIENDGMLKTSYLKELGLFF